MGPCGTFWNTHISYSALQATGNRYMYDVGSNFCYSKRDYMYSKLPFEKKVMSLVCTHHLAVDQQTRARDRTFEGVPDSR